ncbi:MAG: hypothetical protein ACO2Z9_01065 [Crocinitomicaceae bacterium]
MRHFFLLPFLALFSCQQERKINTEDFTEDQLDSLANNLTFRYGDPVELNGGEILAIPIGNFSDDWRKSKKSFEYSSSEVIADWNLLFYNRLQDSTYLLTEEKMRFSQIQTPNKESNTPNHILYYTYAKDTDTSGILNYEDAQQLYISNLDGSKFKQITADNESLEYIRRSQKQNEIYIKTMVDINNDLRFTSEDLGQWYIYNVAEQSAPKPIIDSAIQNKIGKLFLENWMK